MPSTLFKTSGLFIGDILFASSIANRIHQESDVYGDHDVDIQISLLQPLRLLNNNPYISNVLVPADKIDEGKYDTVINLQPITSQGIPATNQFQTQANISTKDQTLGYSVYTDTTDDYLAKLMFQRYREEGKKIICFQQNWEEKSFLFTPDQYRRGVDIPNLGYGGRRRNINGIITELSKNDGIQLVKIGKENGYNQRDSNISVINEYSMTASYIKNADFFIGSEGGLSNLSAGIINGPTCIITTDFIAQLYGPNGCIRKHEIPTMGPATYFPSSGHTHLNPFLTDLEVVEQILYYINNPDKSSVYDWRNLS